MDKRGWMVGLCALMVGLSVMKVSAGDWRFPLGLTYNQGVWDLVDWYEDYLNADADFVMPVGISFAPYYQTEHGSRWGADFGPLFILTKEEKHDDDSEVTYFALPLGLSYGFTFLPKAAWSPYAQVGVKYHAVHSDEVDSSTPGVFGALGLEFMRQKMVGWGLEVSYDASEVRMEDDEEIRPGAFGASLRAIF